MWRKKCPGTLWDWCQASKEFPLALFSALFQNLRNSRRWKMGTLSKTCRWEMVTDPKLGCQKWVPDQNSAVRSGHLTETRRWNMVTWPMSRVPYLTDTYWLGDHISPTSFGQVTTSDSQVLVWYPLLTAEFWIGNYFSPTRIGQGTHFSPTTITRILK